MNLTIRYAVVFNRRKKLKKNGTAPVEIRAYLKGKTCFFPTGFYIKPSQWDGGNLNWIKGHANAYQLNSNIRNQCDAFQRFELNLIARGERVSLSRLKDLRNSEIDNNKISFTAFYKKELAETKVK